MPDLATDTEHGPVSERPRDARREVGEWEAERERSRGDGQALPDTNGGDRDGRRDEPIGDPEERATSERDSPINWGKYEPAIKRWEAITGHQAPSPTEFGPRGNVRLSPRFAEWMMGVPPGWITGLGFPRKDMFRLIGNGVVPLQAALAIRGLMDEESISSSDQWLAA